MADFRDTLNCYEPVVLHNGATIDLSDGAMTPPTNQRLVKTLAIAFVLADITAGTKASASLPANALILGVHISMTTALTFTGTDTTGVTGEIGNVDTDGFGTATQLSEVVGVHRPAAGALSGSVVAGSTGGAVVTFVGTGPATDLADGVTAGAGTAHTSTTSTSPSSIAGRNNGPGG